MPTPEQPSLDNVEMQFTADDIGVAADATDIIADAKLQEADAEFRSLHADSDIDRLRAELDLRDASLKQIKAMAADSRFQWEIEQIKDLPESE